jgi:hypothetical protein
VNISPFLKQTVEWLPKTGTDNRSDPIYGQPQTVPCRKVQKLRDIFGADGETITATTSVLLTESPAIGDLLDSREVVAITSLIDIDGSLIGVTALTR